MANFPVPHNVKVSHKFFDKMIGKAKVIVDEESQKMAADMQMILRLRFKLKGEPDSRSPKWDPSPNKFPESKGSFKNWTVQKRKNGEYWLGNISEGNDAYNYVRNLVTGEGWSSAINFGTNLHKKLVRGPNGGLFSTQMPQGLGPWKAVKKQDLFNNIQKRFYKEL